MNLEDINLLLVWRFVPRCPPDATHELILGSTAMSLQATHMHASVPILTVLISKSFHLFYITGT